MDTDLTLVARTPAEMVTAQHDLVAWCTEKAKSLETELREARANLKAAKDAKWRTSGWLNVVSRIQKTLLFYGKVREAIEAGYIVIPNLPLDVFAIRTTRTHARDTSLQKYVSDIPDEPAQQLPSGEGEYVSPTPQARRSTDLKDEKGVVQVRVFGAELVDFVFPVVAVQPYVIHATQQALVAKLFDEIGLVQPVRRKDPIVAGRIISPKSTRWHLKAVTFFIAWWLDTRTL